MLGLKSAPQHTHITKTLILFAPFFSDFPALTQKCRGEGEKKEEEKEGRGRERRGKRERGKEKLGVEKKDLTLFQTKTLQVLFHLPGMLS